MWNLWNSRSDSTHQYWMTQKRDVSCTVRTTGRTMGRRARRMVGRRAGRMMERRAGRTVERMERVDWCHLQYPSVRRLFATLPPQKTDIENFDNSPSSSRRLPRYVAYFSPTNYPSKWMYSTASQPPQGVTEPSRTVTAVVKPQKSDTLWAPKSPFQSWPQSRSVKGATTNTNMRKQWDANLLPSVHPISTICVNWGVTVIYSVDVR